MHIHPATFVLLLAFANVVVGGGLLGGVTGVLGGKDGGGLLGGVLGGNEGEGGLLGLNLSGTLGSILGKSDDPAKAAKTSAFFGNLHKLLYNVLTDSPDAFGTGVSDAERKYLARTLVNQIRGGGFCDLKTPNSYSTQFGGLVNQ